jgi:hypothetical protein
MGVRTPVICWAVHTRKRQVINSRNCCICLVDLFETIFLWIISYPVITLAWSEVHSIKDGAWNCTVVVTVTEADNSQGH